MSAFPTHSSRKSKSKTKRGLSASGILGGKQILNSNPSSSSEWITLVRQGIPASAIDAVMNVLEISQLELCKTLNIPIRTLVRRKKEGLLTPEESEKLHRLARVTERSVEVFESIDLALDWLKIPNGSLEGATPLSLLDTDLGSQSVMDILGRIEHGVFS